MSRHEPRQEIARAFGATDIVAERDKAAVEAVMEITDGIGADAVLECVDRAVGTGFDDGGEGRDLIGRKPRRMAFPADVLQTIGAVFVEAVDPVAQRLTVHATDPGRRIPAHPIQHRCQRKQAPALVGVTGVRSKAAKGGSAEIAPQRDGGRHGANPPRAEGITTIADPLPS